MADQITAEDLQKGLDALKAEHKEAIKEVQKAVLEKSEEAVRAANKRIEDLESSKSDLEGQITELETKLKDVNKEGAKPEHFNDVMAKAIEENADALKGFG